jgi:hypothetical protein
VASGTAEAELARAEAALASVQEAQAELAERSHRSLPERFAA